MTRRLFLLLIALVAIAPAKANEMRPGYQEFSQKNATDWRLVWKAPLRGGETPDTRTVLPAGCVLTGAVDADKGGLNSLHVREPDGWKKMA